MKLLCQEIVKKTNSACTFSFPDNDKTNGLFDTLVSAIEEEFGTVIPERLVDIAVYIEYANRPENEWRFIGFLTQMARKYSRNSILLYKRRKYGMVSFEDEWLSAHGISRKYLKNLITDKPAKVVVGTVFEDPIRLRRLNQNVGYLLCHTRTSGWDPASSACSKCVFAERCMEDLSESCPDLYELRLRAKC